MGTAARASFLGAAWCLPAFLCLLAVGCDEGRRPDTDTAGNATETGTANSVHTDGFYVWGAEVNVFSPCGTDVQLWVRGDAGTLTTLRERYEALSIAPYEPVFARLRGGDAGEAREGFPADFDGLFRVDEVLEVRRIEPTDCQPAG